MPPLHHSHLVLALILPLLLGAIARPAHASADEPASDPSSEATPASPSAEAGGGSVEPATDRDLHLDLERERRRTRRLRRAGRWWIGIGVTFGLAAFVSYYATCGAIGEGDYGGCGGFALLTGAYFMVPSLAIGVPMLVVAKRRERNRIEVTLRTDRNLVGAVLTLRL